MIVEPTLTDRDHARIQSKPAQLCDHRLGIGGDLLSVVRVDSDRCPHIGLGVSQRHRLREVLAPVADAYDWIFIDCPPSLGLLTVNALVAADTVLVPLQCEFFALSGVSELMSTVSRVRANFNPQLNVEGIVFTMVDERTNLTTQVMEDVRRTFPGVVFDAIVPRNVRLAEAPSFGRPILLYDIRSKGAEAYLALTKEMLRREAKSSR